MRFRDWETGDCITFFSIIAQPLRGYQLYRLWVILALKQSYKLKPNRAYKRLTLIAKYNRFRELKKFPDNSSRKKKLSSQKKPPIRAGRIYIELGAGEKRA